MTGHPPPSSAMIAYVPGEVILGTDYVVTRRLGSGGQGEVYAVWNKVLKARFVIKLLNPELVGHDAERMFQKEAQLMTQLRHRNIVRVVNAGWTHEVTRRPFYIMDEEVGALPLSELIASRTPLAVSNVITVGIQVCDALHKTHTLTGPNKQLLGAIHRDIKPANLLLTEGDDDETPVLVKVLDFGIAWALQYVVNGAVARSFHGTVAYAAPEQHIGRALVQSDIYSLAVVLYELLAERHPFWDAVDVNDMMASHRFTKARPLTEYVVGLPASLVALIAKNLDKDPTKRSASAAELKADLLACAREVQAIKQSRALDQVTTDNMLIVKKVEARKEENDKSVANALAAHAERTGSSADINKDWFQTGPVGPPVEAPVLPSYASLPAYQPHAATSSAAATPAVTAAVHAAPVTRPAAGVPSPQILRGAALPPGTPLLVPPKGATFATTDPDPPRTSPPASAARPSAPTPSQNAKMRAAVTQEQALPPPTERVNPDGSTKKSTGTKPMSEAYKREREPQGPRASTAFMAEAPTLPWYSGLQRRCSNAWHAVRHPVEAWETWKYRRELNESDKRKGRGPLASRRIGKGLIALAAIAGVIAFAWMAFHRDRRSAPAAAVVVAPSTTTAAALPAGTSASPSPAAPSLAAPDQAPTVPVSSASAALVSAPSTASTATAMATPHPKASKGPVPLKSTAPKSFDPTQPTYPTAPLRTVPKPAGESPKVGM